MDPKEVGSMTARDLCPDKTETIYHIIEERKQQKIKKKYSSQHECFKCGGRKTSESEIQSRSLDEGSTLIIICEMEDCSNTWTLSS
jgi:DNA-directed RNA polymerase subunit M/transcription elongation factor TFIIS